MTHPLELVAAGGAAFAAAAVNAVAGGGTLISFPALVALGVPAVHANATNTVSLCPGYLGGAYAQRSDLTHQTGRVRQLLVGAATGGLTGSILLVTTSEDLFRAVVPVLILGACLLLALQDRIRQYVATRPADQRLPSGAVLAVFGGAVYGGYFGAGLGIVLLAVLGVVVHEHLTRVNALKQVVSLVVNVVAAVFLSFSGKVEWTFAGAMAIGSLIGGNAGGRLVARIPARPLRAVVIALGVVVAVRFWM